LLPLFLIFGDDSDEYLVNRLFVVLGPVVEQYMHGHVLNFAMVLIELSQHGGISEVALDHGLLDVVEDESLPTRPLVLTDNLRYLVVQ
jgi:hypothetical protein